ncbi:MAG: M48 family metallopeptidase, partial [Pseudomonadota bacterium]
NFSMIEDDRKLLSEYESYSQFVEAQKSRYPHLHLKFEVIEDRSIGPNAFAIAGGTIMVTKQLMDQVGDPRFVKAILLHEIGHVEKNHVLQNIIQRAGLSLFLFAIVGADDISAIPLMVMTNSYSRDLEREADRFAAKAMLANNQQPAILAEALQKLTGHRKSGSTEQQVESFLSTHPLTEERVSYLKKYGDDQERGDRLRDMDDDDRSLKSEQESTPK